MQNRTIKFRAWDKKEEKMYEVAGISPHREIMVAKKVKGGSQYFLIEDKHIEKYHIYEHGDVILLEYSGLKDKNGKEIYEGDIVKWSDGDYKHPSNPRIAEVRFDPELCFFAFNVDGGHKFGFSNFIYTDTEKHIEVIGNIYENPELLNPNTT